MLIRIALMAGFVLLSPLVVIVALRGRRATAFDALRARVREIGRTSAADAVAVLRSTFAQLVAQGAFDKMKPVAIPPFGTFKFAEVFSVYG